MLRHLRIENLVLARDVFLELDPGLNLVTGETGAGKSLLVGAIGLLIGGRGEASLVRRGESRARVEALFDLSRRPDVEEAVRRAGYDTDGHELLVRREIGADGRTRAFVGGQSITVSLLRDLLAGLVELHGQHEPQTLFDPAFHRAVLDRFGDHGDLLAEVRRLATRIHEIDQLTRDLEERERTRRDRLESLRWRLGELEKVRPRAGEEEDLRQERERLRHAEEIVEAIRSALDLVYEGEDSALDRVHAAARRMRAQAVHDPLYEDIADRLDDVRAQIQEIAADLRSGVDEVSPDPGRLAEIEDRLVALERLRRRFDGAPLEDIVADAEKIRGEIAALEDQAEEAAGLRAERDELAARWREAAERLSSARRDAAARLAGRVTELLAALAMPEARVEVRIDSRPPGEIVGTVAAVHGLDEVELLLRANPGEPARPLRKVASGGEISRVMLALDIALEGGLPPRTLVFDEVDQGLGGEAAVRLGEFLSRVAERHQVIVITHLPQVAARPGRHVHVAKKTRSGRTVAVVRTLEDEDERARELARMLGGSVVTDTARRHAEAMLRGEVRELPGEGGEGR